LSEARVTVVAMFDVAAVRITGWRHMGDSTTATAAGHRKPTRRRKAEVVRDGR